MLDEDFIRENADAHKQIMDRLSSEEHEHAQILARLEQLEALVAPLNDLAATGRVGRFFVKFMIGLSAFVVAVLTLLHFLDRTN